MRKKILFLSFYFGPDLCAGSFRNTPLAYELARQAEDENVEIDVLTTLPNRYQTYNIEATQIEQIGNMSIRRIQLPTHHSGIKDQINSFKKYFGEVQKIVKYEKYDLIYASSSRLFTAYLGYKIAKRMKIPLYLDIRDVFVDTIKDVFPNPLTKALMLPVMRYIEAQTFNYATHINLISGGFRHYFEKFQAPNLSEFSNGIDPVFLDAVKSGFQPKNKIKTILYAGNIGEGQGLHRIVPQAAKALGSEYKFRIIGDGGAKAKLLNALTEITNVEILPPVSRELLIEEYNSADFLFIHLNDYEAFKKVLPSKVFELGIFPKPLIAGVNGFSKNFIEENLPNSILFEPCNSTDLIKKIKNYTQQTSLDRAKFVDAFKRETINKKMARSILSYL